jgi:hypothetical protein
MMASVPQISWYYFRCDKYTELMRLISAAQETRAATNDMLAPGTGLICTGLLGLIVRPFRTEHSRRNSARTVLCDLQRCGSTTKQRSGSARVRFRHDCIE